MYNFEVENWHTYFVGENALLVHNSPPCVSSAITNTAEQLAKSWDDLGKLMHCFTGATLVKTIDGYLPIEQIKVGEKVSAFDLSQNKETFQEVLEVYQNTATNIVRLFVDNELIECTPSHKFWVVEQNDWIPGVILLKQSKNSTEMPVETTLLLEELRYLDLENNILELKS
ncbi:polymorphic toxin-type HINT domain-containing protein [Capnocytophaga canimorsus]|uniref:polymorphic toxin-type HINT domain-containing protein n=1 Tax=Capnocytophaga canimorsus TaxID=28188 RepID=UPI00385A81F7